MNLDSCDNTRYAMSESPVRWEVLLLPHAWKSAGDFKAFLIANKLYNVNAENEVERRVPISV